LREGELAEELGISRVPVREALHRLEGEGLVTIRANHGASVAGISQHELVEIAEACRLLEGHLLRRAIPALTATDLEAAEELLAQLDQNGDQAEWSRTNWRFHTRLYRAAERPLVIELLSGLRARAESAMLLLIASPERRAHLNREHRAILERVRARDVEASLALLDAHLLRGKDKVLDLVEDEAEPRH
jgi:DNA-binding GntR family transcriptional regulator